MDVTIFTYAVGKFNDEGKAILNNISCAFKGVFSYLSDNDDIKTKMSNYYQVIAATLTFESVAWEGPYLDVIGSGYYNFFKIKI